MGQRNKTKICTRCKFEKGIENFYWDKRWNIPHSKCKKCFSEINIINYRKRYEKDPQKYIKKTDVWRRANPDKVQQHQLKGRLKRRMEVLQVYGGKNPKCACCGEKEYCFLAIDHINGLGAEHRKKGIIGTILIMFLRKNNYPEGYQILCHNCNMAKGFYGICPHKGKVLMEVDSLGRKK